MHRFLIIIERGENNYSAYSPDLPGCVATGVTQEEVERNMHEAIKWHIDGMKADGMAVPKPQSIAEYVLV